MYVGAMCVTCTHVYIGGCVLPVQVSQRALVKRRGSAEDRTEGRVQSKAVKRTVVKSDGDETEVYVFRYISVHSD